MSRIRGTAILLLLWLAYAIAPALSAGEMAEREVSYRGEQSSEFDRSYDLYRPAEDAKGGALVIFVHSRFWRERLPSDWIEGSFVAGLVDAGHTVAVLRHRLLPDGQHPIAVTDAARGVASLLDRVEAGEFNSERVFLVGHSSGAQIALLLALDPTWLRAEGKRANALAGVVSISGIVDLLPAIALSHEEEAIYAAAFSDLDTRLAASPTSHKSASRPSILLLNAARDVPGYRAAAIRLADSLRESGPAAVEAFVANGRNHFSILRLDDPRNDARRHIFEFLDSDPRSGRLPLSWRVVATWRDPPYTTEDFHTRFPKLVEEFSADESFHRVANRPFRMNPGDPRRFNVDRYQAIDLIRLVDALGASRVGDGEWLELRNVRGEWAGFSIAQLRKLAPRVVIGVDSERNLFRATDLYHTVRRYSWVDSEPVRVDMARPLGAFLYFPGEQPSFDEGSGHFGRYGLTIDSFRRRPDDPFAVFSDLPPLIQTTLTTTLSCISCHQFRDVGGRAHHIRADDGSPMGGYALPLERYPAVVWKRFVFDQAAVAKEIGATPVDFRPEVAGALHDLLVQEKKRREIESWTHPERDRVPD